MNSLIQMKIESKNSHGQKIIQIFNINNINYLTINKDSHIIELYYNNLSFIGEFVHNGVSFVDKSVLMSKIFGNNIEFILVDFNEEKTNEYKFLLKDFTISSKELSEKKYYTRLNLLKNEFVRQIVELYVYVFNKREVNKNEH